MVGLSREEWVGLFEEHGRSGLSEKAFCEKRGVCPKRFNLRKKQLGWARRGAVVPAIPAFVRVETAAAKAAPRAQVAEIQSVEPRVLLRLGRCEWELRGMSEDRLLRLMTALA